MSITPVSVNFRELVSQPTTHVASVSPTAVPAGQIWVVEHISGRIETTTDRNARLDSIAFTVDKAPLVGTFMPVPNPPLTNPQRTSYQFGQLARMYISAGQSLTLLVDGEQIVFVEAWVTGQVEPA
jgi:hypothetical protein